MVIIKIINAQSVTSHIHIRATVDFETASRFGDAETSALPTSSAISVIPSFLILTMAKYRRCEIKPKIESIAFAAVTLPNRLISALSLKFQPGFVVAVTRD